MKRFSKFWVSTCFVLVLTISFLVGNAVGDNTPGASATVTTDEVDICKMQATIIGTNIVDVADFLECIAKANAAD